MVLTGAVPPPGVQGLHAVPGGHGAGALVARHARHGPGGVVAPLRKAQLDAPVQGEPQVWGAMGNRGLFGETQARTGKSCTGVKKFIETEMYMDKDALQKICNEKKMHTGKD